MQKQRILTHTIQAMSAIGLLSSTALADTCYSAVTPFTHIGKVYLSCGFPPPAVTTNGWGEAYKVSWQKKINAGHTSGAPGTVVTVEGFDSTGNVVCTASDDDPNVAGTPQNCPASAVSFRVSATY